QRLGVGFAVPRFHHFGADPGDEGGVGAVGGAAAQRPDRGGDVVAADAAVFGGLDFGGVDGDGEGRRPFAGGEGEEGRAAGFGVDRVDRVGEAFGEGVQFGAEGFDRAAGAG